MTSSTVSFLMFLQRRPCGLCCMGKSAKRCSCSRLFNALFRWTPEIFGTKVRGTACGAASALSRMYVVLISCIIARLTGSIRGGMIAPILGGILLVANRSIPVYTSVVTFVIAGSCVLLLKEDNSPRQRGKRSIVH
jgi:hypothetical protein